MTWEVADRQPVGCQHEIALFAWAADYEAFGKAWEYVPGSTVPPSIEVNLRFPGQYLDRETGLHYNWHRYYDPNAGRYLTPDPIILAAPSSSADDIPRAVREHLRRRTLTMVGIDDQRNPFAYAGNQPTRFVDPKGLYWVCVSPALPLPSTRQVCCSFKWTEDVCDVLSSSGCLVIDIGAGMNPMGGVHTDAEFEGAAERGWQNHFNYYYVQ